MKSKKITAWLLFAAMVFTLLPNSFVFAAMDDIKVTTASMARDDIAVKNGTDFALTNNDSMNGVFPGTGPTNYDGTPATEIKYLRRNQDFIIEAESIDGQFYDASGLPLDEALKIMYLDVDKNPLKIELGDDWAGFTFVSGESTDWIKLTDDAANIQRTIYNLEEFWTKSVDELGIKDKNQPTVSKIVTADHKIMAHLFNAIGDQFAGYIRIESLDTTGAKLTKDYPIIADGQYPSAAITSTTKRHRVGEYNDPANLPEVENTFIASTDFETPEDYITYTDGEGNEISPYISRRYAKLDEAKLLEALKNADESVWTMEDVKITSLEIADQHISSGIKDVKYYIDNIQNINDISIETRKASGELRDDIGVTEVTGITTITADFDTSGKYTGPDIVIGKANQGMNILTVIVEDNAGLKKTNKYFFFIDTASPTAKFKLVELENKNVIGLFTVADVVTNRQLAIDMNGSTDAVVTPVTWVSKLRAPDYSDPAITDAEIIVPNDSKYQYRLLAAKAGALGDSSDNIPVGYVAADGNDWKIWSNDTTTPVIDKNFDGIIQVRVQDRAGNWSSIVTQTTDGEETIITDNVNPTIAVREFANDGAARSSIEGGTGTPLMFEGAAVTTTITNATEGYETLAENEKITSITGQNGPWINKSAVLEVTITDKDLSDVVRSSGLEAGLIKVDATYHDDNQTKEIKVWKEGSTYDTVTDTINITSDHMYGSNDDKDLKFFVEYEGTGVVDIKVSVKDQADVEDNDDFSTIYNVQLRVDKINPYIVYKGYDITDDSETNLLKPNTANTDYEVRNMPWGPNSQVLEVVVKDDDVTPVQSKTKNIKFNSDKPLDLYTVNGDTFTKIKTYNAGNDNEVELSDCEELANEKYESNVGYKFYLVYEGTGIAKIEFYADDKAGNVRDYPSAQAVPVEYDAMLRVDKINPEIKNAKLVQTADDVNDGFMLFSVRETNVDVNTRKQMKLAFEITDENTTAEQSGVNIQNEKITNVDLMDVYSKYVESDKTHLYDNEATVYATDEVNDEAVDPNIDYILLPVEVGEINGLGGTFTDPASGSNADIEALVNTYIDRYADTAHPVEWKKASWEDGMIVVPDEFQGAIVLRTIDRVGNVDYSEPITFVAESRDPLIDFKPQSGYIYSQNNYGWSKRDWDYIEIKIKDDNEEKVDAWFENAFIKVTDFEGNDISAASTVEFARTLDEATDTDPSALTYQSLSGYGTAHAEYGYDVIADIIAAGKTIEREARDDKGYIHLGYVRVSQSAQVKVTLFDKAKYNDADYSGNKTTGIWTSRIDRVAPVITAFDLVPVYEGAEKENENNGFALKITAEDALSGMAPDITEADYNVYTPENIPATGVFAADASYLYKITNDTDVEIERFNSGTFNDGQYEMPGLQYALIPGNGDLEEVAPWNFESDPSTIYDVNGYNGEMGKPYVWHNYVDDKTPMIPEDFDGLIVVRAIDKAGNITVVGYSSILDVEADDDWNNETQYIQVRTDNKWDDGSIVNVQYYGNNNLLFPVDMRKDLANSLNNGEGAVIEIAEEGITNVVIAATEEFTAVRTAKAKNDQRNSDWEGDMIIGNASAGGYIDWKFQVVDVKIDKTNPEFAFELIDEADNRITDKAVAGSVTIKLTDIIDPIPNIPDELGYRSHIPSGIAKVEWCAVPEGSSEEAWKAADDWKNGKVGILDADAFTGTIKIRVIDNAGNTAEKSQRIHIDGVNAIINLSKSYDDIYSLEPVDVFVTVTENDEFSDVAKVVYEVTDEEGNVIESDSLTLIGGTVSVDREGVSKVKVTAETKAGVKESKEIIVKIDRTAPTFDLDVVDSVGTVKDRSTNEDVTIKAENVEDAVSGIAKVEYAVIPEGSAEENYTEIAEVYGKYEVDYTAAEAFTGTVKVRVTDVAGHETVKSMKINIDKKAPLVVISKSNEEDYSKENVNVFVTVTENAEYSDVVSVSYKVNGGDAKELALTGGTISVTEEGTTEIVVTAKTKAGVEATASTTVLIDKTAPTFDLDVVDSVGTVKDRSTNEDVTIKAENVEDAVSGIAKVEYAVIPEGSAEENYTEIAEVYGKYEVDYTAAEAFTGTVKVRVTDVAGHETVKSMKINIDKKAPLVVISKSNDNEWGKDPVDVFVTVSENAEFSDVKEVKYEVEYEDGSTAEGKLTLTGGTISIDKEGVTNVKITAVTKAGVKATAETKVRIDRTAPTFDLKLTYTKEIEGGEKVEQELKDGEPTASKVKVKAENVNGTVSTVDKIEWCAVAEGSVNEVWTDITVSKTAELDNASAFTGTVKVRVTDKAGNVTVKTQRIKIDPTAALISISKSYDKEWGKDPVDVFVTVSENAEFSDVKEVKYEVEYEDGSTAEGKLTLTGGTISIDKEGVTNVKITAVTKAGVKATAETKVRIDRTAPTFGLKLTYTKEIEGGEKVEQELKDGEKTASDVTVKAEDVDGTVSTVDKIEWCAVAEGSVNEVWTDITVSKTAEISNNFIGTVKVRVTDKAGNVTVKTQRITVDKGTPVISIDRIEEPFENVISIPATKDAVVIGITANKGTCISEVKSLTYTIAKDGAGEFVGKYMNPNGGNIVLNDEGTWDITNIKAVMESGVEYTYPNAIVVTIDRKAPNLSGTKVTEGDEPALFSISSTKRQNLTIKAVDDRLKSVEYAVVEKGAEPEWISVPEYTSGTEQTITDVINKAFDGTVMVRATDTVGNVSVWTQNVFTEGIKPEISLTSAGYNGGWISQDAFITVDILDKGVSSQIMEIEYTLKDNNKPDSENTRKGSLSGELHENWAKLNSNGGVIVISKEGDYTLDVTATDYAGNSSTQSVNVKIDKTAPTYSGSVGLSLFNVHDIPESDWNYIHDGWTYNHDVSLEGLTDSLSGIDKVSVTFTGKDGTITKDDVQTSYTFSASGRYDVVITDKAGNVRNISFTIDKNLKYAINVVEVDSVGKLNIAVTDGNARLSFYQKEEDGSSFTKMFNGVTDQLWDGRTGVRKIYAQDDSGNKTNTLYVLVAPTADYGVSLMSLTPAPNRYVDVALDGEEVTVVKNAELFNPDLNQSIGVNSEVELNEDGIYTITIK